MRKLIFVLNLALFLMLGNMVDTASARPKYDRRRQPPLRDYVKETYPPKAPPKKPQIITELTRDLEKEALNAATAFENSLAENTIVSSERFDARMSPAKRLEHKRRLLESDIVGQPEVIEALINMERRKDITGPGQREQSEILYLMGLPRTGKDTSAQAYARSMHGDKWRKSYFEISPMRGLEDLWTLFGSNTGYIGQDTISPLIKFLVQHSGGRYILMTSQDEGSRRKEYVEENPKWKPRSPALATFQLPEEAVIYINEFHNWPREAKDAFGKMIFEQSRFPINNPGPGITHIFVPATIIIASNDGVELVASRDGQGRPVGKPLDYPALLQRWEKAHNNKDLLIKSMVNQQVNRAEERSQKGISEELVRRIPKANLLLMRPLSPADLLQIARIKVAALEKKYKEARGAFGNIDIDIKEDVIKFLAEYKTNAEEGAGSIDHKVASLIEETLMQGIYEHADPKAESHHLSVHLDKMENGTHSLIFEYHPSRQPNQIFEIPIAATQGDRPLEPLSAETIARLAKVSENIQAKVFGVAPVADAIQDAMLVGTEATQRLSERDASQTGGAAPATVFLFLGLSSTGKTETAKAIADETPNGADSLKIIDFGNVQTMMDFRRKILGTFDERGRPVKSEFMEHYDKYNGQVVVVLDEIANANREILQGLYDLCRESVVNGFSDGEPRKMTGVILIGTGNGGGTETFDGIPKDVPKSMRMYVMQEVYRMAMKNPGYRRTLLEKHFSAPLLNRIGEQNIFYFPPHTFKSLRELSQLKLMQALKRLEPTESGWGWKVQFQTEKDYQLFLDMVETDGFVIDEQGASVDRFVRKNFETNLRSLLLSKQVASGSDVTLAYLGRKKSTEDNLVTIRWRIIVGDASTALEFPMIGVQDHESLPTTKESKVLTAYHETGHELVRHVLFGKQFEPKRVSMIPGVTQIGDKWVQYLGIAQTEQKVHITPTRQTIIQDIAVLLAGEQAELLVSRTVSGGKANDIERATELARLAVLRMGLSETWGNQAPGPHETVKEFIQGLSEDRRKVLESEINIFLAEAKELARRTIIANYDSHFVPMAMALATKGELSGAEIKTFYQNADVQIPERENLKVQGAQTPISEMMMPETIADIDAIIAARRTTAIAEVASVPALPVRGSKCGSIFEKPHP